MKPLLPSLLVVSVSAAFLVLLCLAYTPPLSPAPGGTCQDVIAMDVATLSQVLALTRGLVSDQFFAIFHVSIDRPCPFWDADGGKCAIRECSVCDCPADEVPALWRSADAADTAADTAAAAAQAAHAAPGISVNTAIPFACEKLGDGDSLNDIDRSYEGAQQSNWAAPPDKEDWTVQDNGGGTEMLYVDLRKNPERYTGFSGKETHRIWSAIYDENCIVSADKCRDGLCAPETCKEERVFHKLISGVHTSITMHIAGGYLLGTKWGKNVEIYEKRVRKFPERVENLKLTLALILRAVAKVAPSLDPAVFEYKTGNAEQDRETAQRVRALLAHPVLARGCEELVFDEKDMFVAQARDRLPEFRGAFRNISMIMDCVGCEKCRLWGKLQFLGLGTALRILFTQNDERRLKRNEVIALVNLLHKLLSSAEWVDEFDNQLKRRAVQYALLGKLGGGLAICLVSLAAFKKQQRDEKSSSTSKRSALLELSKKSTESVVNSDPPASQPLRRRRQANAD